MAALPIVLHPHPILREKAKRIRKIDASLQRLIDDMIDTMREAHGVGLAGNQVGVPLRVCVVEVPEDRVRVLINPEIIKASEEVEVEEGCLSIPGIWGEVVRNRLVTVKALDRNGKEIRFKASDMLAQAVQHEIDHLNGILFIDRIESADKIYRVDEEGHRIQEASLNLPPG